MAGTNLVALFQRAVDDFTDKVRAVGGEQWQQPTPCTAWDVQTLVNHVVGEQLWVPPLFAGQTIADVGDQFSGDVLAPDPVASADRAGAAANAAVAGDGALERTVHLSFGDFPGAEYAWQLLADHLIHGWDLAVATGLEPTLDPDAVDAVAGWFVEREEQYRQGGFIGPRLAVPADADPATRLLAGYGRDADWAP